MSAASDTVGKNGNAYNIFIMVLTVFSLAIMVLQLLPLSQALKDLLLVYIYHFMFGPSCQAGCPVNSSIADGVNGLIPHLNARDVTMLVVSQASLDQLQTYKRRMG